MSTTVDTSLRDGARLHAFRSGGGLRVLRVETDRLIGYGEAPTFTEALRILADDIAAGGRRYEDVYGKSKPHYLTGTSEPAGDADRWLLRGNTIDAHSEGGAIVAILSGWGEQKPPAAATDAAAKGETTHWGARGYAYKTAPCTFQNGERGTTTECLSKAKDGADPWMWRTTQTGSGADLTSAIAAALVATPIEAAKEPR